MVLVMARPKSPTVQLRGDCRVINICSAFEQCSQEIRKLYFVFLGGGEVAEDGYRLLQDVVEVGQGGTSVG